MKREVFATVWNSMILESSESWDKLVFLFYQILRDEEAYKYADKSFSDCRADIDCWMRRRYHSSKSDFDMFLRLHLQYRPHGYPRSITAKEDHIKNLSLSEIKEIMYDKCLEYPSSMRRKAYKEMLKKVKQLRPELFFE